jgi:hypothetical protein
MLDRILDMVDRVLGGPPPKPGAVTRHRVRIVWPARVVAGLGALATVALLVLPGGFGTVAQAAPEGSGFSRTVTIERTHLEADGSDTTVDSRTISVTVDQTQNLRGRQQIRLSWSGAHPTGGIVADPNSAAASRQEYPVVIFECRGLDTAGAPADQRLDPTTCWTQTPDERYQASFNTAFPAWRLDRYAPASERTDVVDAPNPNPCTGQPLAARYVPFVAAPSGTGAQATVTTYFGGANGCAGIPPDGVTVQEAAAPPTNTTYAATGTDGTGQATFIVSTQQQNASLGCSDQLACELVIIPIMGVGCDATASALPLEDRPPADEAAADDTACRSAGHYDPGELFSSAFGKGDGDPAVSGALWWSASNWRNRITVPITFAAPPNACDILDTRTPLDIYGSELMDQATLQWTAEFCKDPRKFKFRHVRTGEPQAKSALAGGAIDAAFVSRPPSTGYVGPTVSAPVAVTGFAVTFTVDDNNKREVINLKLNPRLLAKLLSESYWAFPSLKADYLALTPGSPGIEYKAMASNPQDMALDPEFQALNPGISSTVQFQSAGTLLALSGNSDVMYALTSYINADPEARAFLNGQPDPWGMIVNPGYKGIALPTEAWPLLDTFLSPDIDLDGCLRTDKGALAPIPILPLVAAPVASLTTIAQAMQYSLANSNTICVPRLNQSLQQIGGTLKARGRQQPGSRFMLGITSVADAEFFGLRMAALQSYAVVPDLKAKFTDDTGRHFVVPSDSGMIAALKLSTFDKPTGTWPISYTKLRTAAGQNAYPGTLVVYAAIPTRGLAAADAAHFAQLLTFAATDGQQPGITDGQLPAGYVPMTAANGLGALVAYTQRAAVAVGAQTGAVPPLTTIPGHPATGGNNGGNSGGNNGGNNTGGGTHTQRPSPAPEFTPWTPGVELPLGYTPSMRSQVARWTMPSALLVAVLAAALALVIQAAATMRAAGNLRLRLSHLVEARRRQ